MSQSANSPEPLSASVVVCKEVFDEGYQPSREEIIDYATKIGINPDKEPHLLRIARDGLMKALPDDWQPCYSDQYQAYYYFNVVTKETQWDHPLDAIYKKLVAEARQSQRESEDPDSGIKSLAANDDSRPPVMRRINGKFLAPLEGKAAAENIVNRPLKPIGRVDQIRRQFDVVKVDESSLNKPIMDSPGKPPVKGFTLTGTGSMFLKSNTKKLPEPIGSDSSVTKPINIENKRPSEKPIIASSPNMKGILRDSSLGDVRSRPTDTSLDSEDKKSVRFNLNEQSPRDSNPIQRPSSALNKNLNINFASSDDEDNSSDFEEEQEEEEEEEVEEKEPEWDFSTTPVREIKVTPSIKKEITSIEKVSLETEKEKLTTKMRHELEEFRLKLGQEKEAEQNRLRQEMKSQIGNLKREIAERNKSEVDVFELEVVKATNKQELDKVINEERNRFKKESNETIQRIQEENKWKLQKVVQDEEKNFQKLLELRKEELDDRHQKKLGEIEMELEARVKASRFEIEENYKDVLEKFKTELQEEFEEKRKAISENHKAVVETLQKNHSEILQELERDLKLEEELIKKEHSTQLAQLRVKFTHETEVEKLKMRENGEDYEKIRCEKRLLEDKYRCLKEKYVRLKTDVKLSLEKRNNRKREQQIINSSETEKSNSHKTQGDPKTDSCMSDKQQEKRDRSQDGQGKEKRFSVGDRYLKQIGHYNNHDDTTSISQSDNTVSNRLNFSTGHAVDNGNSDSEALFVKSQDYYRISDQKSGNKAKEAIPGRQRKKVFTRTKSASTSRLNSTKNVEPSRPCTPVETLRRQLQKLEDLEDQFPDNTLDATYHLRYPFSDVVINYGNSSSELEFFKHRIHLERDSVRRAKENLKTQRTNFRTRQRDIKQRHKTNTRHTLDQLINEEKELTEMEVNLHRTRALLGEKVIRLRHLEMSLQKICEKEKPFSLDNKSIAPKEDATLSDLSSHSSSGFSSTDFASDANQLNNNSNKKSGLGSTDIMQNLETLNAEIREIWDILNRQPSSNVSAFYPSDMDWSFNATGPNLPLTQNAGNFLENYRQSRNFSTLVSQSPLAGHYTSTLVERTRDLRNWLRQAKQEHERAQNQPTL